MIHSSLRRAGRLAALLVATLPATSLSQDAGQSPVPPASATGLEYIDTSFENASPLWYDFVDNVVRLHLLYDHERASPNRAAGHIHFMIHARPGTTMTLEFLNLDNVWNGQPGSVAGELKTVAISEDGHTWKTVPTESLPGNRVQLSVDMRTPQLYVARIEPYRLSDLDRLLARSAATVSCRSRQSATPWRAAIWRSSALAAWLPLITCSSARGRIRGSPAATGSRRD